MQWDGVHALVECARTGDQNAWTDLFALARDYLLGLAQSLLGPGWPHQTAHDLAQDTWMQFCKNIGDFRGGADDEQTGAVLRAWLGKTAAQLSKNYIRDNHAQKRATPHGTWRLASGTDGSSSGEMAIDPPSGDPTPSHPERLKERRQMIDRALGRLPNAIDRDIVALHYFQECPLQEVADRLGLTYDQTRSRLRDIKRLLKGELQSHDDDLEQS